jgi:cell division protein FtsW (lipid II flippase)
MNIYNKKYWEKKYFDLWSVIHFNSGVVFAFLCVYLELPLVISLVLLFCLAVAWEIAEIVKFPKNLLEPLTNQVTDVLVALLGMFLVFRFLPTYTTSPDFFSWFVVVYTLFALLIARIGRKAVGGYSKGAI